ncbi:MAG: electron transfer flavoprotein subunit beta/FixA family protein [Formivibrio sp.]|nr:electron transfer flavoprotein subunit beta/FixA family protein [Formivibrio sp.]
MKVLVAVKRVPDGNVPLRFKPEGAGLDVAGMPMRINPFDEAALEWAAQAKEAGTISEIIAVSIGGEACQETLRHALALGANRAVRIDTDQPLEPLAVAKLLRALAEREQPALILLGKQASDDDNAQTAPMLAALLDWPQGVFASTLVLENNTLQVTREIEGGQEVLALPMPAVISADLRLANPRYLKLPQLLQAKKKTIETLDPSELGVTLAPRLALLQMAPTPARKPAVTLAHASELVHRLRQEGLP